MKIISNKNSRGTQLDLLIVVIRVMVTLNILGEKICIALVFLKQLSLVLVIMAISAQSFGIENTRNQEISLENVEELVITYLEESQVPGVSVLVVRDRNTILKQGYGYNNSDKTTFVDTETRFELASNTKAFTGLAVLLLVDEKKLKLDEDISAYIPSFNLRYKGEVQEVKLNDLLNHRSGIPFSALKQLSQGVDDSILKEDVWSLMGSDLINKPGEAFHYSSLNYDVLGLIIQEVSSISYEEFIKSRILEPLGMFDSGFYYGADEGKKSSGFKINLFEAKTYHPPMYRGNAPAAYLESNLEDMEQFVNYLLNPDQIRDKELRTAITKDIESKYYRNFDGSESKYEAGWIVEKNSPTIRYHAGANPIFSSYVAFDKRKGNAVVVLANMNSDYTRFLGKDLMSLIGGTTINKRIPRGDTYQSVDTCSVIIAILSVCVCVIISVLSFKLANDFRMKRRVVGVSFTKIISFIAVITLSVVIAYYLENIPFLVFGGLDWATVIVWAPQSLYVAKLSLLLMLLMTVMYSFALSMFPRDRTV